MVRCVAGDRRSQFSLRAVYSHESTSWLWWKAPKTIPASVLNAIKAVPEVCRIYCASANPTEVIVAETAQGRGIVGVIDGFPPLGVENDDDVRWRKELLRNIGYKA